MFFFQLSGDHRDLHVLTHSFPTLRSSDLQILVDRDDDRRQQPGQHEEDAGEREAPDGPRRAGPARKRDAKETARHGRQRGQNALRIQATAQYPSREDLPLEPPAYAGPGLRYGYRIFFTDV